MPVPTQTRNRKSTARAATAKEIADAKKDAGNKFIEKFKNLSIIYKAKKGNKEAKTILLKELRKLQREELGKILANRDKSRNRTSTIIRDAVGSNNFPTARKKIEKTDASAIKKYKYGIKFGQKFKIPLYKQDPKLKTCWFHSIRMLEAFNKHPVTSLESICGKHTPDPCEVGLADTNSLIELSRDSNNGGHINYQIKSIDDGTFIDETGHVHVGVITYNSKNLLDLLQKKGPIIFGHYAPDYGLHMAVITGVNKNGTIHINDPYFGEITRDVNWLNNNLVATNGPPLLYMEKNKST